MKIPIQRWDTDIYYRRPPPPPRPSPKQESRESPLCQGGAHDRLLNDLPWSESSAGLPRHFLGGLFWSGSLACSRKSRCSTTSSSASTRGRPLSFFMLRRLPQSRGPHQAAGASKSWLGGDRDGALHASHVGGPSGF